MNNNENNNNLDDMSEIERDKAEREKGRRLHHHRPIENAFERVAYISFYVTIASIVIGIILWILSKNDITYPPILANIIFIGFISSALICVISMIICIIIKMINDYLARKYCPYCYKKDFNKTLLSETCIRAYTKYEKKEKDGIKIRVPVRIEDWKAIYRNECCGQEYEKTWQNKINLSD